MKALTQLEPTWARLPLFQAGWLAAHMADTGRSISRVLREAIDLYIAEETSRVAPNVATAQDPVREHVECAPVHVS